MVDREFRHKMGDYVVYREAIIAVKEKEIVLSQKLFQLRDISGRCMHGKLRAPATQWLELEDKHLA